MGYVKHCTNVGCHDPVELGLGERPVVILGNRVVKCASHGDVLWLNYWFPACDVAGVSVYYHGIIAEKEGGLR